MDAETITLVLTVVILGVVLPVLILARSAARGKVSRQAAAIAEELGLGHDRAPGPGREPLLEDLWLFRRDGRMVVGDLMRGEYRGHRVLVADVLEPPVLPPAGRWGLAGLLTMLGGLLGPLLGGLMLVVYPRGSAESNYLVILLLDPLPKLPDFLIEPRSAPAPGEPGGLDPIPALLRDYDSWGEGLHLLPPAFFERVARVLVGRPNRWAVQGVGGRLGVWISGWRSPTALRPSRSYRAVLDDVLSLREALDPVAPGSSPPLAAAPPAGRKSIRAALERIRGEPGPNHRGR